MDPDPNASDPGEEYGRALKDRIVRDAKAACCDWAGPARRQQQAIPRLVIGLSIMAAGLALALDSLGVLDAGVVLRYWPLIIVAVGVAKLTSATNDRQRGLVWIAAGGGFLLVTLGRMSFGGVWAMLLLFVGANVVWRALRPPLPRAGGPGDASESFDMVAVLGGAKTGATSTDLRGGAGSRNFKGGRAMAVMGGCEIDLRRAAIADGSEAVVDVFVMWGGIEIKVPEDWDVVNHGSAFLGAFENKTRPLPGASRRLIVTGTAIMGGVEVKN
ncbi:MAG: LiaF transmembrane domain-containing protein [Betaproteobacteria bacterium]